MRRTVESVAAQAGRRALSVDRHLQHAGNNVVVTAVQLGATQDQIAATRKLLDFNTSMLTIVRYQFKKGYASQVDSPPRRLCRPQTEATLPPLMKQEAQLQHQLAVLVGNFPGAATPQNFQLASLALPQNIPVSLPSALVEQRPDVLQAQANMHSASALIGVAVANRLPNLTLTANAGSSALQFGQLFTPGTDFWNIGAALAAPIFDGNTLLHQERAARANYTQAAEQYRSTVLTAFQNVADSLTALQQDADALQVRRRGRTRCRGDAGHHPVAVAGRLCAQIQLLNAEAGLSAGRISRCRRRRPAAMPIPPRCSRRWAAAGGTSTDLAGRPMRTRCFQAGAIAVRACCWRAAAKAMTRTTRPVPHNVTLTDAQRQQYQASTPCSSRAFTQGVIPPASWISTMTRPPACWRPFPAP